MGRTEPIRLTGLDGLGHSMSSGTVSNSRQRGSTVNENPPWRLRSRKPILSITPEDPKRRWISVTPPEGVPLTFALASLSDRFVALFLDLMIIVGSLLLLVFVVYVVIIGALLGGSGSWASMPFLSLMLLALFVIRQGYFLFFEWIWQGTTPGKRYASIQVISRDGGALSIPALISRNLLRDVEIFVPLGLLLSPQQVTQIPSWMTFPAIGWIAIMVAIPALNYERLRIGDLLGGTVVISVPKASLQADKARQNTNEKQETIAFTTKQLAIYGELELEALADILRKTDQQQAHVEDLQIIARAIATKIEYKGPEPSNAPLLFLRTFYAAQRSTLEKKLLFGQRKSSQHSD